MQAQLQPDRPADRVEWNFHTLRSRMVTMKRGPIGVWFSIAVILLILSLWVGTMIGSDVARHLYGHPPVVEHFSGPERDRVQAELLDVDLAQAAQLASVVPAREEF